MSWPGPDPVELADGSLVVSVTAPRAGVVVVRAIGEIDILTAPAWRRTLTEHEVDLVVVADDRGMVDKLVRISGLDRHVGVRAGLDHAVMSSPWMSW